MAGAVRLAYGANGLTMLEAYPGDHLYIPQREVHRESNPADEEQVLAVVRVGRGPVMITVDVPIGLIPPRVDRRRNPYHTSYGERQTSSLLHAERLLADDRVAHEIRLLHRD